MAALLELPPELYDRIQSHLERPDLKRLRLASRECAQLATPHIFREILFDLDPSGCDGLVAIAKTPRLARYVQVIHLKRRTGLKAFYTEDDWYCANIYEYVSDEDDEPVEPMTNFTGRISKSDWRRMSSLSLNVLWREYESDLNEIERYFAALAAALSTQLMPSPNDQRQAVFRSSAAWAVLDAFTSAIGTLSAVHTLAHTPTFEHPNWGRTWRYLEFHPDGLEALAVDSIDDIDVDIDALQLFIARRSVLQAPNALRRIEQCTREDALWSVQPLRSLVDWDLASSRYHQRSRGRDPDLDRWADSISRASVSQQYTTILAQELRAFERGVSTLKSLKCCTLTQRSNSSELIRTATAIFNVLKQAVQLESLELVYNRPHYLYTDDRTWDVSRSSGMLIPSWTRVSDHLLRGLGSSLQQVRHLQLSLITSIRPLLAMLGNMPRLRHLGLSRTALLPGERWETVFAWIVDHLALDSVQLCALEDVVGRNPRMILHPQSPVLTDLDSIPCRPWTKAKAARVWREYEDGIVNYVLRWSTAAPVLDLELFLRQWCDRMYPTEMERWGVDRPGGEDSE